MGHWLADPAKSGQAVHLAGFAPAFTLSFHDSELKISEANALANDTSRTSGDRQMPIAWVVMGKCRKKRRPEKRHYSQKYYNGRTDNKYDFRFRNNKLKKKKMKKMKDDLYSKWEKQRKNKWLYVFLRGSIYLGLPVGTLIYLLKNNFTIENLHFSDFIEKIVFSAIIGFVIVLLDFNRRDKIFLDNNVDIREGIKRLKSGKDWKYENLAITNVNNETLIVRNKLFWFDKSEDLSAKSKECYNTISSDYEQLKKDKEFDEFSKNFKVRIQIYDVLDREKPLIDQAI